MLVFLAAMVAPLVAPDGEMSHARPVHLELASWRDEDLALLFALNRPEVVGALLGDVESPERVRQRHHCYRDLPGGRMFTVRVDGERAGAIGYWPRTWGDVPVFETGWTLLPRYWRRGIASAAARVLVARLAGEADRPAVHAFPAAGDPASNGVCRRAGFTFRGAATLEFPPGHPVRAHDWAVALGP